MASGPVRDSYDVSLAHDERGNLFQADGSGSQGDRRLERWLLRDWLDPSRRKEPALPFLPKAKFNSGDAAALFLKSLKRSQPSLRRLKMERTSRRKRRDRTLKVGRQRVAGDNPIIAAGALILAAGVANALGERAIGLIS